MIELTNTQIKKLRKCKTNNEIERKLDQLGIEYDDVFAVSKTVFDPEDNLSFWGGDMDEFPDNEKFFLHW